MSLIYGKTVAANEAVQLIDALISPLGQVLQATVPVERVLQCAQVFTDKLAQQEILNDVDPLIIDDLKIFCRPESLKAKLLHELGENPFSLRRYDYTQANYETWRPLGVVLHVTPSNSASLPFLALIESLLVGNVNWLRPSSSDDGLTIKLVQAFLSCDSSDTLKDYIAVVELPSSELPVLLNHVDGVSAWGGDTALSSIREQLPITCRWISWGHKISFAWIMPSAMQDQDYSALADEICRFNQQACSSPQIVFADTENLDELADVGEKLQQAMQQRSTQWPYDAPDEKAAADITSAGVFADLDNAFTDIQAKHWKGPTWSILLQDKSEIEPSVLYRNILLRPLPRTRLINTLRPWRGYLQTCGLKADAAGTISMSQLLLSAGVNRVTTLSGMHGGYEGEPHDGVFSLAQLLRRVSVSLDDATLPGLATLDLPPEPPPIIEDKPIMDKQGFISQQHEKSPAQLFFRSGGSSGTPKLSGFTYRDYHTQMQAAADGLFAAGLDPKSDRVINLMYAGNLYGGMLSHFTALDKVGVFQLPMGKPEDDDFTEVATTIISQRVNTILGMPSTIGQLFRQCEQQMRDYGGIRKLLTGGEHINGALRSYFESFGVETIRSSIYGSVDAGPLAYSCAHCPDGVFHLMTDIQWLEIVDMESDKPVKPGEAGRLIFTSRSRDGHQVIRYDIGDIGRWVDEPCPSGNPAPRFELLGRHGNILRIGSIFLVPQQLAKLAGVPVQFLLESNRQNGLELMKVYAEGKPADIQQKISSDPQLQVALKGKRLELQVIESQFSDFQRHAQSGKTPLVIDKRR